ncbi:hypothetical protein CVI1001048_90003 [Tenacibaculum maritimum]|nr:hypothetical protein JIP32914_480003 [Tenacibaculum maritimum]CAA0247939.1 hypothetical protein CVI1001048_90003 [Tenacibaculum maritimum]
MIKKITIKIIFFLLCVNLNAQERYLNLHSNFGLPVEQNMFKYTKYPSNFRLYKEYNSYSDNKNEFPEETLISVLSADNYRWDSQNYDYKIKNHELKYKLRKELKKEEAFFELLLKISFRANDSDYAIIKYHVKEKDNILPNCSVLKKVKDKWKIIETKGSLTKAFFMFNYISVKALEALFNNSKININSYDKYIEKVYKGGILEYDKALSEKSNNTEEDFKVIMDPILMKLKVNFEPLIYEKNNFKNLTKKNIKVNYIKELTYQKFYEYVDSTYNSALKDDLSNTFLKKIKQNNEIKPIFRFEFDYKNERYCIFKYQELIKTEGKRSLTVLFRKEMSNEWSLEKDPISLKNNVFYKVLSNMNLLFYKELMVLKNNPNYPEINKLKPFVKDANGVLNIEKLAKVLEENKTLLAKYLDN